MFVCNVTEQLHSFELCIACSCSYASRSLLSACIAVPRLLLEESRQLFSQCPVLILVQVEQAPRRASLRQRGVQADGAAVDTESRGGHVTLVNGEAIRYPSEPAQPRERHPQV